MHLLRAEPQRIDGGEEAVDLDLAPAPVVLLSSADSELAAFTDAAAATGADIRLAAIADLAHPLSVDLAIDRTLRHAKLVAVRLIGGEGYWPYGVDRLRALARGGGPRLLIVSGEPGFDAALAAEGTVDPALARAFHDYCREGGPENRINALRLLRHIAGEGEPPTEPAVPFPLAGLWWPGAGAVTLDTLRARWPAADAPVVALAFYRSHLLDGLTGGVAALVEALAGRGLAVLPVFASSLKDPAAAAIVSRLFAEAPPRLVLTTMAFSLTGGAAGSGTILDHAGAPVLQVVQAGASAEAWRESTRGLGIKDLAMNVVTTELDGRVLTRAVAFKERAAPDPATGARPVRLVPQADRVDFTADLARNWVKLAETPPAERRIVLVLANYPGKDGRIANGVGLDTPASTVAVLRALAAHGYRVENAPADSAALMTRLLTGPTNARPEHCAGGDRADGGHAGGETLALSQYRKWFDQLPTTAQQSVTAQWGPPEADPIVQGGAFRLAVHRLGNVAVAIQPPRGYERDVRATYHDPALVPPHAYLAFYLWLREAFGAHGIVHLGKHGNLEWLPGKALALSAECWPEIALGPLPHVYPFIVNDPGEGSQAKRRASAVIVDHLTPPMTRAESHGAAADLERLLDEYALAASVDPRRARLVSAEIVEIAERHGFDRDIGVDFRADPEAALIALDSHVCDLRELQIRDGLHVFGASPEGRQRTDLLAAMARLPRGQGEADGSLQRAIAADLGLGDFDPLDCEMAAPWRGPRPSAIAEIADGPWRTAGDTVERVELTAAAFLAGEIAPPPEMARTHRMLDAIARDLAPRLDRCGPDEMRGLLTALDGRFVPPGPSGAPTRGRLDVVPTGRNFFSVDTRAVPTEAAWRIGWKAAQAVVDRYVMEEGDWPRAIAFTCWGTANMRTGGDDIAQALALIGARPVWERASGRVTGFEVIALSELMRPRVDVTLRISGFFRDAFPDQINLFQSAVAAIAALDEPDDQNPIAANVRRAAGTLVEEPAEAARARAAARVFGSMPGAYGAGLQALIDSSEWRDRAELAGAFVTWGGYAYGPRSEGDAAHADFRARLAATDAVLQAQDNREHDLLDSDDYYQFEGGLAAAVEAESGRAPVSLHLDSSRPERPVARTLSEEIGRVVRARAANPKWIAGMMRHGYKGAFEIAATVDYLFAFAATTDAVGHHHFDQLYAAYVEDETVRAFLEEANAPALAEIAARFLEAIERGLWAPASNSAHGRLAALARPAQRQETREMAR